MGIFGNDKEQDARLDAVEEWLMGLSNVVRAHKLETTELRIEIKKIEAHIGALENQVGERLTEDDFDPAIMKLSEGLAEARVMVKEASEAAEEGWQKLQMAALDKLDEINAELDKV